MNLSHACRQLRGQVSSAEVDVEQRGLNAAVAGEGGNLVDVPPSARQIGQAEMTERARAESLDAARRATFRMTFDQLQMEMGSE